MVEELILSGADIVKVRTFLNRMIPIIFRIKISFILLDWIELNWIELNWIELNWIELNWIELNWIVLYWIVLFCFGLLCIVLYRKTSNNSNSNFLSLDWHWSGICLHNKEANRCWVSSTISCTRMCWFWWVSASSTYRCTVSTLWPYERSMS